MLVTAVDICFRVSIHTENCQVGDLCGLCSSGRSIVERTVILPKGITKKKIGFLAVEIYVSIVVPAFTL
jgi:hypothetical protein